MIAVYWLLAVWKPVFSCSCCWTGSEHCSWCWKKR